MAPRKSLRAWLTLSLALSLASCSDDEEELVLSDGAVADGGSRVAEAGVDAGMDAGIDGGPDAAPPVPDAGRPLQACLERPQELDRPPTGELPCELLPPGFSR